VKKVTEVYCWIAENPAQGSEEAAEGIVAANKIIAGREMMMPLIMTGSGRRDLLREAAAEIAKETGRDLRLCKFAFVEVVDEIKSAN
jgi:hypothetical protein